MPPLDVLVLGKGPAGLAAAAALADGGLAVGVLGPAGPIRWPAQYGAWRDQLEGIGWGEAVGRAWPRTAVRFGTGRERILPRSYVRVDKGRLAAELRERCERGGVRWLDGEAVGAEHRATGSGVRRADGGEIAATLVVDASGHRPALVGRGSDPPLGFQVAVGWTMEIEGAGWDPEQAVLMDWDDAHLPPSERGGDPTFLYALPLADGLLFAEETSLVGRPALVPERLEERLRLRLRALGVRARRVVEREVCWIPMGGPIPDPRQRVVGFGGAAGMVHPATGYLLGRTLAAAPELAAALAGALGSGGADPRRAARAGWEAIWPPDRQRRHALFCFGMEVLLRLDARGMREFFGTFFDLPAREWRGFLDDRLTSRELAATMARFSAHAPLRTHRVLARAALARPGFRLAASLLRPRVG